MQPRGQ